MQNDASRQPSLGSQPAPPLESQVQPTADVPSPQSPTQQATRWYKSTWFMVLLLILIPPLGLVLMWLLAPWKNYTKVLVTVPAVLTSIVFSAGVVQSIVTHGSVLTDEQAKMEHFLEDKYTKKFVIKDGKIVDHSGIYYLGFKFKTYEANVSPADDPSMVFTASRIVEGRSLDRGEDYPDKLNYSDDYLLKRWTRELQGGVKSVVMNQPINAFTVDFRMELAGTMAERAEFYDKIWGTVPKYRELPLKLRQGLTLMINIKATGPVDANKVEAYAAAMIAARDLLDPNKQNLGVQVTSFEVYHNEKDSKPGWEWQNVGHVQMGKVKSVNELTPYFVQWTNGYGRYYNPKTRAFDMSHPE